MACIRGQYRGEIPNDNARDGAVGGRILQGLPFRDVIARANHNRRLPPRRLVFVCFDLLWPIQMKRRHHEQKAIILHSSTLERVKQNLAEYRGAGTRSRTDTP